MSLDAHSFVHQETTKLRQALDRLGRDPYPGLLSDVAGAVLKSLEGGGKVMFCGNGGSAADAQHLAAELVGRRAGAVADHVVAVPATETPKIQELHIVCGHIIFALVEQARFGSA